MNRPKSLPILISSVCFFSALSIHSNASPFTIDGSTVHVNAGFVGIRTSTPITALDVNGDAQFGAGSTKSTFTAAGLLKLTASGIQWADGTTSTTTSSGGGGGVPSSSYTTIAANTAYGSYDGDLSTCVATVTFTPTASSVDIIFTGEGKIAGSGYWAAVGFLVDGAYAAGFDKDTAVAMSANSGGSAMYKNLSFIYTDVPVTANTSHTFCLLSSHYTGSGFTMCGADSVYGPANRCRFGVREVK